MLPLIFTWFPSCCLFVLRQTLADVVHVTDDGMLRLHLESDIRVGGFLEPSAGGTAAVALRAVDNIA